MKKYKDTVQLCNDCLANIERHNNALSAFITVDPDSVREQAAEADAAAARGEWLGILHGMPIALKDNIDTAGIRTTSGARPWRQHIPSNDATVVRRLKDAGAIIVGKTTLGELVFDIRSHNPIVGPAGNPWNTQHSPGGSSGGSAAAVAADMAVGALGSDTGGSIRLPAAHSGVAGLRPTHGAVSTRGVMPVSFQNDTIGPMARRVSDVARIFAAIEGFDGADPYSRKYEYGNFMSRIHGDLRGIRVGIPQNFFFNDVAPEITTAVMDVAQALQERGAELIKLELQGAENTHTQTSTLIYADVAAYHRALLDQPESMTAPMYERLRRGLDISAVDYANALVFKKQWKRTLYNAFQNVHLLLTPTSPIVALPNSEVADLHSMTARAAQFTYAGTLAAIPGLSVPCGFTPSGLPIGGLLQARWWNEPLLFLAGNAFQSVTNWHLRTPSLLKSNIS